MNSSVHNSVASAEVFLFIDDNIGSNGRMMAKSVQVMEGT
jgi:hypothetical protein